MYASRFKSPKNAPCAKSQCIKSHKNLQKRSWRRCGVAPTPNTFFHREKGQPVSRLSVLKFAQNTCFSCVIFAPKAQDDAAGDVQECERDLDQNYMFATSPALPGTWRVWSKIIKTCVFCVTGTRVCWIVIPPTETFRSEQVRTCGGPAAVQLSAARGAWIRVVLESASRNAARISVPTLGSAVAPLTFRSERFRNAIV